MYIHRALKSNAAFLLLILFICSLFSVFKQNVEKLIILLGVYYEVADVGGGVLGLSSFFCTILSKL